MEALSLKGKTVLGYVGTFSADYEGLEYIIRALPLIKEKCPEAVLLLVGDGKLRSHLETIAKRMGVRENVMFAGRIAHDSVLDYYSIMDICVYPRKRTKETGLVTAPKPLEAMASGKAIIGSDVGGIEELISEEETGVLFESGNIDDVAKQCVSLVSASWKRELLGQRTRHWVEGNRNWITIVAGYTEIYRKLLNNVR